MIRALAAHVLALILGVTSAHGLARPSSSPAALHGHVSKIHDGDTFTLGRKSIRLFGIDAPELDSRHGTQAREALRRAIGGGAVRCLDTRGRSHGRIVARCTSSRGEDLAQIMVAGGWAVDWWRFSHGAYRATQREAQRARRGMFAADVKPWRERWRTDRHCGP